MSKILEHLGIIVILLSSYLINLSFSQKVERHAGDIFKMDYTFIESHRGVNREKPENTMEAFKKAVEYGIEAIETDTWLTKDGVLVIVHGGSDGEIGDYYDHSGKVTELTWEELKKYRTIEGGLPMPSLEELFIYAKETKLFINLEIKDKRRELVFPVLIRLIEYYDMFDKIELSSFHHEYIDSVNYYNERTNGPYLIFSFINNFYDDLKFNYTGSALNIHWVGIDKNVCLKAKENGMSVMAWFAMVEIETDFIYQELMDAGVHVITTNEPLKAKLFRDKYYAQKRKNQQQQKTSTTTFLGK